MKVSVDGRRISTVPILISIENGYNMSYHAKANICVIRLQQLDSSDEPTMILNLLIYRCDDTLGSCQAPAAEIASEAWNTLRIISILYGLKRGLGQRMKVPVVGARRRGTR